jgi:hypothetical protein
MAKLFDQQQLSAGVQEFEEHLHRVRARDWTVDCQLAKPHNDLPAPVRREAVRRAATYATYNASGAAPGEGKTQPASLSTETFESRRLILALAALVLVTFAGAMSLALMDGAAPTAEEDVAAVASDAPSTAPESSQATQPKTPAAVATQASVTSETYVATIRPDGSLAPDTTPHATLAPRAAATPPAAVPAPNPDAIGAIITSGRQSEPAPSAPAEANTPGENPAAAKPAKRRAGAKAAKLASANPAAAEAERGATVANPAEPGRAAAAAQPVAAKPIATKPVASKRRPASVAAANKTDGASRGAPDAEDGGGIFESAKQAVGSLTGAVKNLVGAD